MPRRTDLQSILILGSGPIVVGQAAEFDYNGTQAVQALREEGYRAILVNSNPATIIIDLADANWCNLNGYPGLDSARPSPCTGVILLPPV